MNDVWLCKGNDKWLQIANCAKEGQVMVCKGKVGGGGVTDIANFVEVWWIDVEHVKKLMFELCLNYTASDNKNKKNHVTSNTFIINKNIAGYKIIDIASIWIWIVQMNRIIQSIFPYTKFHHWSFVLLPPYLTIRPLGRLIVIS